MLQTFREQIAVEKLTEAAFVSKCPPQKLANTAPIGYGGCTIAIAVHAACLTVPRSFNVFVVSGSFLGPAQTDRRLHCDAERVRDTRSFATRRVRVFQLHGNGAQRACATILVDFHAREPPLLTYGLPIPPCYGKDANDRNSSLPTSTILEQAEKSGLITAAAVAGFKTMHNMLDNYFETNHCLAGVSGQNALGLAKEAVTSLDHLPVQDKVSAEWTRSREQLVTHEEKTAALGFTMDAGLSFLPLTFEHMYLDDASACSTLEFSLRIIVSDVDISQWCLRERKTIAAAAGRTYSESRLWQDGGLVAIMTQTSILRPLAFASEKPKSTL